MGIGKSALCEGVFVPIRGVLEIFLPENAKNVALRFIDRKKVHRLASGSNTPHPDRARSPSRFRCNKQDSHPTTCKVVHHQVRRRKH